MPTREEALAELYRRGALSDTQKAALLAELYRLGSLSDTQNSAVEELGRRGVVNLGVLPQGQEQPTLSQPRQEALTEMAGEVGPFQAFAIGAGRGLTNVGRGLGLVDQPDEIEQAAMGALEEQRPYSTGAGQMAGEAAPFLIPGSAASSIASLPLRVLASGALGGVEGAILERGRGGAGYEGAGMGAGIGMGAEILFPVLGRLGSKIFRKVTGRVPRGSMLDIAGRPTQELQQALDAAGMSFDDLTQDAIDLISKAKPGSNPEQVARAVLFREAGVQATKGEITKDFGQLATEQRLAESAADTAAEPFRQFKLKQSESIKDSLRRNFGVDVTTEETGQAVKDALIGRKSLLRTQKNDLYKIAAENAKDSGGIPLFTDSLVESIPDQKLARRLSILDKRGSESLNDWLMEFGLVEPTEKFLKKGIEPERLNISNFEDFRIGLNQIGNSSEAMQVATSRIKRALDNEVSELGNVLKDKGVSEDIFGPLLKARDTVRQLKTEFSPGNIVGKITNTKRDGVTPVIEASKIYDKLVSKALPVEEVKRVTKSLSSSDEGKKALASLQASTILDLIDAGFGTESRKISGVKVFNPIAFKRRLASIGDAKLRSIFEGNTKTIRNLNNIEKIASDLVPPAGAVPKGSASVILDLANKLGLASISAKVPGGGILLGSLQKLSEPIKKGAEVRSAMMAEPEVKQLVSSFPGIAAAFGISFANSEE